MPAINLGFNQGGSQGGALGILGSTTTIPLRKLPPLKNSFGGNLGFNSQTGSNSSPLFMGTKARNPAANIQTPNQTLTSSQTQTQNQQKNQQQNQTQNQPTGGGTPAQTQNNQQQNQTQNQQNNSTGGNGQYNVNPNLQGQLITGLANTQTNPQLQKVQSLIQNEIQSYQQQLGNLYNEPGLGQQEFMGRSQALADVFNNTLSNLNNYYTALQGEQGKQQAALGGAASANAPITGVPYGTQTISPASASYTSGTQYGTGPAAAANVSSIQGLTSQVNNWGAARSNAQNIITQQLTPLLTGAGINPSDLNAVNQFIQKIAGQTSSSQYKSFQSIVSELAASYAQILTQPGQDPTNLQTTIAQSLLNATSSGQSIMQVLAQLDATAQSKIQGTQNTISTLNQGGNVNTPPISTAGGNTGGTSASGSTGGGSSSFSYNSFFGQ